MGYKKMLQYGNTLELYEYEKDIAPRQQNISSHARRDVLPVLASDRADSVQRQAQKRQDNAKRARMVFVRLVLANIVEFVRPLLVTLTYAENMQDLRCGYKDFSSFIRLMRCEFGKGFSYIAVPEFQKRGAVHFHCLFWGLPSSVFRDQRSTRLVDRIWSKGWVFMKETYGGVKLAYYLAKYMSKAYLDPRLSSLKAFVSSRNCLRPKECAIGLVWPILDDYKLSTVSPCKDSRYSTHWLGECRHRIYKLEV